MINYLILRKKIILCLSLFYLIFLLDGCVNYFGVRHYQHLKKPEQFATKKSLASQHGAWPKMTWAKDFEPHLPQLIQEGLTNNPDFQVAVARQNQAYALVQGRNGALLPQFHFLGLFAQNNLLFPYQPLHLTGLNFAWDLDFWGKNYSLLAQALSKEKVSQAGLYQSALMIATLIASTYNELDYQYALKQVLLRTLKQRKTLNTITQHLLKSGLATETQVYQAQNAYADIQVQLVSIKGQIITTRQQMGILLGLGPDRGLTLPLPQFYIVKDPKLPDHLPVNLLGRRPDLVAARWQVEAFLYSVKHIKAKFYPNVDLLGVGANNSLSLRRLFGHFSGGSAVTLPLFDGGVLRSELKGQYAKLDEHIALYNSVLNNALGEVAEQIAKIRNVDEQLAVQKKALYAARGAFELAKKQYQFGLTSQTVLLNSETRYLEEQQGRLLLIKSRRDLQIALIKALGGGFEESYLSTPRTTASPNRFLKKDDHV